MRTTLMALCLACATSAACSSNSGPAFDADVHVRLRGQNALEEITADAQQPRQVRDDLEQAHHGEIFGAIPGFAAGRQHARAGNACEPRVGHARAQRFDQMCAEVVARGFAGDEDY